MLHSSPDIKPAAPTKRTTFVIVVIVFVIANCLFHRNAAVPLRVSIVVSLSLLRLYHNIRLIIKGTIAVRSIVIVRYVIALKCNPTFVTHTTSLDLQ